MPLYIIYNMLPAQQQQQPGRRPNRRLDGGGVAEAHSPEGEQAAATPPLSGEICAET